MAEEFKKFTMDLWEGDVEGETCGIRETAVTCDKRSIAAKRDTSPAFSRGQHCRCSEESGCAGRIYDDQWQTRTVRVNDTTGSVINGLSKKDMSLFYESDNGSEMRSQLGKATSRSL